MEGKPDVVGITMTTAVAPTAGAIAARVKAALPNVTVVVGGPHVSGVREEVLQVGEAFDLGVIGEGEQTFKEILEALQNGGSLSRTPGVVYRGGDGEICRTAPRAPIKNMDSLPHPAWDLLPGFPGAYPSNIFFSPGGPAASLNTSRGCPFACTFCDQSTFGHQRRAASPEFVFEAARLLHEEYGIRYLVFCDDTFTIDRACVLRLCEMMRGLKPPVAWSCDVNVMTVDRTLLRAMKGAGCWGVCYGLESGSLKVLESLAKPMDLACVREVIQATRDEGIHAKGLFIMGTPEESRQTAQETRDFLTSLPLSTINLSKFTPYPGSALHAVVADALDADYEQLNGMNFVVPSKYLSIEELEREYYLTIRQFYGTRRAWRFHLPRLLGRRENIRRLLGMACYMVGTRFGRKRNTIAEGER